MFKFSTKVKFQYEGKTYIGRICDVLKNKYYKVLTTGENGQLWLLPESELELFKNPKQKVATC